MGIQQIRRREKVEEEGEEEGEEEKQKQKEIINRRIENFDPQRYLEATTTTATHTMICILLISVCAIHHSSFIIYYILFIGVFIYIYLHLKQVDQHGRKKNQRKTRCGPLPDTITPPLSWALLCTSLVAPSTYLLSLLFFSFSFFIFPSPSSSPVFQGSFDHLVEV